MARPRLNREWIGQIFETLAIEKTATPTREWGEPHRRTQVKKEVIVTIAILTTSLAASAQVSTNCSRTGDSVSCTTIDYGAQQRQAYEAGQQLGNAIGLLIARGIEAHRFHSAIKNECKRLPPLGQWELHNDLGQRWTGNCPLPKVKSVKVEKPKRGSTEIAPDAVTPQQMAKLSDDDKTLVGAAQFMQRHPEYIACPENSKRMIDFMTDNVKGDYPAEADYEQAFSVLKPILKLR